MGAASVAAGGGITRAKFDNTEISAIVSELEPSVSRHSGKQLRRLRLVFRAYEAEAKKSIEGAASDGLHVHLGPDEGGDNTIWILGKHSSSFRNDEPMVTYVWTIAEGEHLEIDHLVIGEASFRPYRYEEEFDGSDILTINAHLTVSTDDWKALRAMSGYFLVVRTGINETPRKMRFGEVLWSTTDDAASYKLRVVLVDEHYDELSPKSHGFFEPFRRNIEVLSSENSLLTDRLMEALIAKGVFDRAEIDSLRAEAAKSIPDKRLEFDRVSDVDEW